MSLRKQFTVGLENKPAELARLCSVVYRAKVNIEAISVVDGIDCSWVRFIASPTNATAAALRKGGFSFSTQRVLVKKVADKPSQLHVIAAALASKKHNIHYVYGSTGDRPSLMLVLGVSDPAKAEKDVSGIKP